MRWHILSTCLLLTCFSCSTSTSLSAKKKKELSMVLAALDGLTADYRVVMASEAVAEIETERLPTPLLSAFAAVSGADPATKSELISRGLSGSMDAVNTMCNGKGDELFHSYAEAAPERRLGIIRKICGTDRFELVDAPTPNTEPIAFLLAHVALSELSSKGGASRDEKSLLRYIALAEIPPELPTEEQEANSNKNGPQPGVSQTGDQRSDGQDSQRTYKVDIKIRKAETVGDLDNGIVQQYVRRKTSQFIKCYVQILPDNPELTGTVDTSFLITPNGSVIQALATGIGHEALESCMAGVLKTIKFPKPNSGGTVEAKFSFALWTKPGPSGQKPTP